MQNQLYIFIVFLLNGFLVGILFDIFRILRKSFKTPDFVTNFEDMTFWILTGLSLLYTIFKFNRGELRAYIFIGVIFGFSMYILIFSETFIKINLFIVTISKRVIAIVFITPIKFLFNLLKKTFFKPFSFIFINIRKAMSKFKIFIINLNNKGKKSNLKKDF